MMEYTVEIITLLVVIVTALYFYRQWTSSLSFTPSTSSTIAKGKFAASAPVTSTTNGVSASVAPSSLLPLNIFFGSQSGTAETYARELAAESKTYGFNGVAVDLADYDRTKLAEEPFAVFLLATFGEGDPTDNAADFFEWITTDDHETTLLQSVDFAVFALGNRQYEHFCRIGRVVDERMFALGGQRLLELGEGDDDGSLEDDFTVWKKSFWRVAQNRFHTAAVNASAESTALKPYESSIALTYITDEKIQAEYRGDLQNFTGDMKNKHSIATIAVNRELRQSTLDGSTRHIEIDISSTLLSYQTADNLGVFPRNSYQSVSIIIKRLKLNRNDLFNIKSLIPGKKTFLPNPCSILDLFLWYLDFNHPVRVALLPTLITYTSDEDERNKLRHWSTTGKDEFVLYSRSLTELLLELPNINPPLADVLDWCPKLAPRYYTISSSATVAPKRPSITVSVITHDKPGGRTAPGICSSYLSSLKPEKDTVAVFVRASAFRYPKVKAAPTVAATITSLPPAIMIGPGTGVAPFMGFIADNSNASAATRRELTLYFGCRTADTDWIYQEEMKRAQRDGALAALYLAFSRHTPQQENGAVKTEEVKSNGVDGVNTDHTPHGKAAAAAALSDSKKTYVQTRLREQAATVWKDIAERNGVVFVCGGTSMGRSVRACLSDIGVTIGGLSTAEAESFIKKLQNEKRFIAELWS